MKKNRKLSKQTAEMRNAKLEEELRKYKLATQWVEENRDEYIGKWVCLDGDKLISFGEDGVKVHREAKAKGVEIPFVVQVIEEPKFYGGGIEMCQ